MNIPYALVTFVRKKDTVTGQRQTASLEQGKIMFTSLGEINTDDLLCITIYNKLRFDGMLLFFPE